MLAAGVFDGRRRRHHHCLKGQCPSHPNWYYNLVANPACTVEIGTETYQATAVLAVDDRKELFDAQAAMMPQFTQYEIDAAPREIPVFRLQRS